MPSVAAEHRKGTQRNRELHEQRCNILKSVFDMQQGHATGAYARKQQGHAARACRKGLTFLRRKAWALATLFGREHVVHLLQKVLPQLLKLGWSRPLQ